MSTNVLLSHPIRLLAGGTITTLKDAADLVLKTSHGRRHKHIAFATGDVLSTAMLSRDPDDIRAATEQAEVYLRSRFLAAPEDASHPH
ncbi:hypothetical protein ACLBXM_09325 [Xanthobacteraceae bacterium A53D]